MYVCNTVVLLTDLQDECYKQVDPHNRGDEPPTYKVYLGPPGKKRNILMYMIISISYSVLQMYLVLPCGVTAVCIQEDLPVVNHHYIIEQNDGCLG